MDEARREARTDGACAESGRPKSLRRNLPAEALLPSKVPANLPAEALLPSKVPANLPAEALRPSKVPANLRTEALLPSKVPANLRAEVALTFKVPANLRAEVALTFKVPANLRAESLLTSQVPMVVGRSNTTPKRLLLTFARLLRADAPAAAVLLRFVVGVVFASEGIQKFLYAEAHGAGRFRRIGIPAPEVMGPFVGVVEVVCGSLLLLGLATRLAAVPLVLTMLVALVSTKLPILLGHGYGIFAHTFAPKTGLWAFLHESRTDLSMLCGSAFLALVGADRWSLDRLLGGCLGTTRERPR